MMTVGADAQGPTAGEGVRIRLLGPIRAFVGGGEDTLGGVKQRTMLAVLLLADGRPMVTVVTASGPTGRATRRRAIEAAGIRE
ncbi:hypothetical protein ABZV75_05915 [Streptomyces flaveolus]|uniref:hypothetical protein n=1 Tax=Streptomyces flaveolus TaxID=67297 RepID=UPI0033A44C82